jgi:hypothetical protein
MFYIMLINPSPPPDQQGLKKNLPPGQLSHHKLNSFSKFTRGLRDEVESILLIMKSIWTDCEWAVCKVIHWEGKAEELSIKSKHLEELSLSINNKQKKREYWGGALLVPALNISKISAVTKTDKYRAARIQLISQAQFGWLTTDRPTLVTASQKGVCGGACLDFAKRLLLVAGQKGINSHDFKKDMLGLAEKYAHGVGKEGVANQVFFQMLKSPYRIHPSPIFETLQPLINMYVQALEKGIDRETVIEVIKKRLNLTAQNLLIPVLEELDHICNSQICGERPLNPNEFIEYLKRHFQDSPGNAEIFFPLCSLYESKINLHAKKIVPLNPPLDEKIRKVGALKSSITTEGMQKIQHAYNSSKNIPLRKYIEIVANYRGMRLENIPQNKISATRRDAENIAQLDTLSSGVYETIIDTENSSRKHALLFIKTGEESFFWDPNIGLIDCMGDVAATFEKLLEGYPNTEPGKEGQHSIQMRQYQIA